MLAPIFAYGCTGLCAMSMIGALFGAHLPPTTAQLPFNYVNVGHVRIDGITESAGRTNLLNIGRKLGPVHIAHARYSSEDHDGFSFVCYRGASAANRFSLTFESDDDMGGTEQRIQSATLALRAATSDKQDKCAQLRDSTADVRTDRGIKLGITRHEVEQILGAPTRAHGDTITYEVTIGSPNPDPESCGPTIQHASILDLFFADDRVVGFKGFRDDQC